MTDFKKLMKEKGFTLETLAQRSGVYLGTLAKLSNGDRSLAGGSLSDCLRLSRAFGMTVDELLATVPTPEAGGLEEGWNELTPDIDFYIEDGCVTQGKKAGAGIVYPYRAVTLDGKPNGYDNATGIEVKDFLRLCRRGEIIWQ